VHKHNFSEKAEGKFGV